MRLSILQRAWLTGILGLVPEESTAGAEVVWLLCSQLASSLPGFSWAVWLDSNRFVFGGIWYWLLVHRFYGGSVTLKSVGVADCAPLWHYYSFLERRMSSRVNFPHFSMYWSWPYLLCHSSRKYRLHRLQDKVVVGVTQAQEVGLPFPFFFQYFCLNVSPSTCLMP